MIKLFDVKQENKLTLEKHLIVYNTPLDPCFRCLNNTLFTKGYFLSIYMPIKKKQMFYITSISPTTFVESYDNAKSFSDYKSKNRDIIMIIELDSQAIIDVIIEFYKQESLINKKINDESISLFIKDSFEEYLFDFGY